MIMDVDVIIGILSKLDPDSLWSMCRTNKEYMRVCNENRDIILKNILKEYNVDYENPRSLVYMDRVRVRGVYQYKYINILDYKRGDGSYKLGEIFLRYKRLYYNESIEMNVGGLGLESIPKMPKLKRLICEDNSLKELPDFESLEYLDCRVNDIVKLGRMPRLVELYMDDNPIREIGGLESLEKLDGGKLLKLERLYSMPLIEVISVSTRGKIKLEDISGGEIKMRVLNVDRDKSLEGYIPETVNVYVSRLDIKLIRTFRNRNIDNIEVD